MVNGAVSPSTRKRVYDTVCRYPGIHVRGIEREVKVSAPLAQYHLKKLEEEKFIEGHEQGGYTRYYPAAKPRIAEKDVALLGLLREEVPLHIALLLLDNAALTHGELLARVGGAKSTLSYHLAKLAAAGLVERVPRSAKLRLAERDRVYALLLAYRPTHDLLDTFSSLWSDLYD